MRIGFGLMLLLCWSTIYAQSNEGKDFWFVYLQHFESINNRKCMITSKYNASGYIEIANIGWRQNFSVQANQVYIADIPSEAEMSTSESISPNSVHVVTDVPSSVYIHHFITFRADASLVLPVESLGTEYYAMTYQGYENELGHFPSEFAIIATEDNTRIQITYSASTQAGRVKGEVQNINLQRGEAYQVQAATIRDDLSGTHIQSNKNIAVFSGNRWTQIPNGYGNRDNLLEQMYPVEVWGKQFVAVPSKTTKVDRYRILASSDNTVITLSGKVNLPGPFTLSKGQWREFELKAQPAFIQSSNPIMVAMFLVGGEYNGRGDEYGDPSMVLLNSIDQYRDTVTLYNSPFQNIRENYINIITTIKDTSTLRIDGRTIYDLYEKFQFIGPNNQYAFVQLSVANGPHILSTGVCGLIAIAYGYGSRESYAYGGGANFTKFNQLPIPDGSCLNDSILFKTGLPEKRFDVIWDLGDGTRINQHQFNYTYKSIGDYTVKLIYHDLCRDQYDSIQKDLKITLRKNLTAYPDTILCEGSNVVLFAEDRPESNYEWTGPNNFSSKAQNIQIQKIQKKQAGKYTVTGYYFGCPTYPIELNIDVVENPVPDLGRDTFFCPDHGTIDLKIDPYKIILWDNLSSGLTRTINKGGVYNIRVEDNFGCIGFDSIIIKEKCPLSIYVPNVFSPNGDQINDEFEIKTSYLESFHLKIFSRWGELVFESFNPEDRWSGRLPNGEFLIPGVYVYLIHAEGYNSKGEFLTEILKGDINLIR